MVFAISKGPVMYETKCLFCGRNIDSYEQSMGNVLHTETAARKGVSKKITYYHEQCYKAEMAKRREARKKRLEGHK